MKSLESLVLKNDMIQAKAYLDGYFFYSNRVKQKEQDLKLAEEYWTRFNELRARKREHDQIEALKNYTIEMGITEIEIDEKIIFVQHISISKY